MSRYDAKADFKVHDIKSMGKPRDAEAMELLKRISHQVQPIMRRREWRVPLLSEFFPANANLLGLNIGGGGGRTREIKVRLRPPRDPDSFLPYESVLGTMLHELVHNVRGPHDGAFYRLLDEITAECEELMARGVGGTGVGFDGPSCGRLGSHAFIPMHNPAPGRLRDYALKAAEERAKRQRMMPSGPRRLGGGDGESNGGSFPIRYATPAAAAAAAAERRCRDNRWCPCERLAGAINRAVAAAEAEAQQGGAQRDGTGLAVGATAAAPAGAGGSAGPGGGDAGPIRTATPLASSQAAIPDGPQRSSRPWPTAAEVEADLVRRIEDGVIDLTLDSDSDLGQDLDNTDQDNLGVGGDIGEQQVTSLPSQQEEQRRHGWLCQGLRCGVEDGTAPEAAVKGHPPSGWIEPGGNNGSGGDGSNGAELLVLLHQSEQLAAAFCADPAAVAAKVPAQQLSAPTGRIASTAATVVGSGPARPPTTTAQQPPPLGVLQSRNPAAAVAAAAALARMQSQQQQRAQIAQNKGVHTAAAVTGHEGQQQRRRRQQREQQPSGVCRQGRRGAGPSLSSLMVTTALSVPGSGGSHGAADGGGGSLDRAPPGNSADVIDLTSDD